ncbi:unnamed protein product [Triticum turgidum subsp. durum]|uniref:RBR-type E3 ubiquitin transferase n=1 Tax=Triticum turgidum subsp. durum TaxID=4567 RepID=A0A9R1RCE6_TRITD|nr:unnamed protein product [Triticum turgidum subsp. durum]
MLNRKEGQRTFQVHVHIEIPDGTDVSARLSFGAGTLNYKGAHDEDASDDLVYKFRVEHLPPILLTCLLPSSYPSHQPPFFTLSTEWLDKVMLSSLCHMLDMIWEEQLGMEVVYQWVQWLQSSSLSYLGFDNEIVLSKGDLTCVEDGGDNRACPDDAPPDLTIPRIIRYNDDKRHEAFLHGIHDCMICFSELPGVVPPNILKRLLGEDEFERWEGLLLQRTLDAMADVVYCPRCQTACLEDVGDEAVCSSCLFSFCTLCRERRHVGVECLSPEEKLIILERRQKSGQVKGDIQKVMDEVRSIKEILKDAKQCPRCKMAISKIEGCNKMTCWNCGRFFCYQCNAAISGYDHFKGDCVVFDQEEIDRWEMQMNQRQQRQVVAQAQAEIFEGEYGYPCPTCRNPIPKVLSKSFICKDRKQQPSLLLGMPTTLLCSVPEGCPQDVAAFWSQGMQATYRRRLTQALPYLQPRCKRNF